MANTTQRRRPVGRWMMAIGIAVAGVAGSGQAAAGCAWYGPLASMPSRWHTPSGPAEWQPGNNDAIVGTWKFSFVSDGTAYPGPIPLGAIADFGTQQWHSDGTEFMISGGRPPSSGDVCMGEWKQTGRSTYVLKHVALAWVSSDTPPPVGPVAPAAFVGPAIIRETVTLNRARTAFEGTFTLDQYAGDGTTLLEHVAGKVIGTRFAID